MPSLVQMMASHLLGTRPLSDPMLTCSQLEPEEHTSVKCLWICNLENGGYFVSVSICYGLRRIPGRIPGTPVTPKKSDPDIKCHQSLSDSKSNSQSQPTLGCAMITEQYRPKLATDIIYFVFTQVSHGPLAKYVKLPVAHTPEMLGTFPRHRGILGIPGASATRNFMYLVRGPYVYSENGRISW